MDDDIGPVLDRVHALAHITGGGVLDNIPRVIPAGLGVTLDKQAWSHPAVFDWLQNEGGIPETEMYRTFNMGIGFCVVVAPQDAQPALDALKRAGEDAIRIGTVTAQPGRTVTIPAHGLTGAGDTFRSASYAPPVREVIWTPGTSSRPTPRLSPPT